MRRVIWVVLLIVNGIVLCGPSPATATTTDALQALIDDQVGRYPRDAHGAIVDPLQPGRQTGYGTPAWGAVALRSAVRTGNEALAQQAMAALMVPIDRGSRSPFDNWALSLAFRDGRRLLAGHPTWQAFAPRIAEYLSLTRPHGGSACLESSSCYNNWKLVELAARATTTAEGLPGVDLARTQETIGLAERSAGLSASGSLLGGTPARAISDPPTFPTAYSIFSAAHLQSAAAQQSQWMSPQLTQLNAELQRYIVAGQAPDGTMAYQARSQRQSWTLAAAIMIGARMHTPEGTAMAHSAWSALQRYGRRADGLVPVAPILRETNAYDGIDGYAGQGVYGPLTLLMLQEAADALHGRSLHGTPLSAQLHGGLDDVGASGLVLRRAASTWVAWQHRATQTQDLRYARGPQSMQVRDRGSWTELLPARPAGAPRLTLLPTLNARPVALNAGATVSADGAVINVTVTGKPGRTVTWPLYLPDASRVSARSVVFDDTRIDAVGQPLKTTVRGRAYMSATHPALRRHTLTSRITAKGRVRFRFRVR